jgi:hypothetical protein
MVLQNHHARMIHERCRFDKMTNKRTFEERLSKTVTLEANHKRHGHIVESRRAQIVRPPELHCGQ